MLRLLGVLWLIARSSAPRDDIPDLRAGTCDIGGITRLPACAGYFVDPPASRRGAVIVMQPPEYRDGRDLAGIVACLPGCCHGDALTDALMWAGGIEVGLDVLSEDTA